MKVFSGDKIRVLLTRHLLEGHDMGLRSVVNGCREAGIEVVYYPRFMDFNEVVKVAEEEDVDMIGISSSSGAHLHLSEGMISALKQRNMETAVIIGGVIPDKDIFMLKESGIKGIFGPGSTPGEVADFIFEFMGKQA